MVTHFEEEDGGLDHEIEYDRATAKIVVDPSRPRGTNLAALLFGPQVI